MKTEIMRDTLKTKAYFNEYICEESERATKFKNKIASGTLAADRVLPVKRKLFSISINLLIAKYSAGTSIDELRMEFLQIIGTVEDCWSAVSYDENLRLLSLCVLFNVDDDIKDRVSKLIGEKGEIDSLIEYLYPGGSQGCFSLCYPDVYAELWDVFCSGDIAAIKVYLQKKWYKSHRDSYWYDAHKSKERLYFGYWAFEVAALMKVLNMDAAGLEGVQYFPYDLYCY